VASQIRWGIFSSLSGVYSALAAPVEARILGRPSADYHSIDATFKNEINQSIEGKQIGAVLNMGFALHQLRRRPDAGRAAACC